VQPVAWSLYRGKEPQVFLPHVARENSKNLFFSLHFLLGIQAYAGLDANSDFCYLRTVFFPQSINLSQKENNTESQG